MKRLAAVFLGLALSACAGKNPYYDPEKPHHTPNGFKNNYPQHENTSGDFWAWRLERWRHDRPAPAQAPVLPMAPDLDFIRGNHGETAVTWIGHSTVLLQVGGLNVLTDPQFSERASPVSFAGPKRAQPPGVALADLPRIDAVVISHSHYDHLDLDSVRALYAQAGGSPMFFVPLGVDAWLKEHVTDGADARIRALDWWDKTEFGGVTLHLLPVQHWSARSLWDRNETLWGAWAVEHPGFRFFFSGDLGYSQDLKDIGRRFDGFDLAAMAIGAYEPRWFMRAQHVNPAEALRAHRDIGARRSFGIHWGTFEGLADDALDQAPRDLAKAREAAGMSEEEFFVLRHGETYRVPGR